MVFLVITMHAQDGPRYLLVDRATDLYDLLDRARAAVILIDQSLPRYVPSDTAGQRYTLTERGAING